MQEVTKDNFAAEVAAVDGPVLVDWWSPRCEPCMELTPELEALAERCAGRVKFCKVNVVENRRLAIAHKVLGLPAIQYWRGGTMLAELVQDDATPEAIAATLAEVFQEVIA